MNVRLKEMIQEFEMRAGRNGKAQLSIASGLSFYTLKRIENEGHIPRPQSVVQLALACGLTEEEAFALARECSSEKAGVTA